MTANDKNSYFGYFNKLIDEYNSTYHRTIAKKSTTADYFLLTEEIELTHKSLEFKIGDRVRINKYNNIFSKVYTENWSREIFVINSVPTTNPWAYKINDLNGKK